MRVTTRTRSLAAIFSGVAMIALAAPGVAGAEAAIFPAGGSSFTGGPQGWTGAGQSCAPAQGLEAACSTTTEYSATVGNPAGSINARIWIGVWTVAWQRSVRRAPTT